MIAHARRLLQMLAFVALAGVCAACGGSGDGGDDADAEAIIGDLKSLKPGEILIQGRRPEKFSGPYELKKGGYQVHFERTGDDGTLTVSVESTKGSKRQPYQLLLDESAQKAGQRTVTVSGKLYVHVRSTADGYVLRLTPRRPGA